MGFELSDLIKGSSGMAYSKIRRINLLPEEQQLEFFNGLFLLAVEARDAEDWSKLDIFIREWEDKAASRSNPNALRFETTPWTPFHKPLRKARVALITTGGAYIKNAQEPFNTDGDTSYRVLSKDTPRDQFGVSHTHYDTSGVLKDVNVIFPYERLKELEREGAIGAFADPCYGFMGFIPGAMVPTLVEQTAPEVARKLVEDGVDAVLIGTT